MENLNASGFSPVSLVAVLVCGYLIWSLPRQYAVCPVLVMVGLMPMGQQLDMFGLHFYLFRLLLLIGMARVMVRGEAARLRWTRGDKLFAWWVVLSVILGTLVKPSIALLVNRLGDAFNEVCCYYFVRSVVLNLDDVLIGVRALAYLSILVAAFMLIERTTRRNLFSVFGGVADFSDIRNGHVRAQGAFRHPILAGTFGATEFPLFVALWFQQRKDRLPAAIGIVTSLIIVVTANSSGALMAAVGAVVGLALWKFRTRMRFLRRMSVGAILVLALLMNAPIWFLFARLSDLVGGGGWHRAFVIDTAVRHFNEWWLFGTTYTAHWGPAGEVIAADPNMMDITNHFVVEGVKGGVLKLGLFIAIIVGSFKLVGRRLQNEEDGEKAAFLIWSLGVCLAAHCLSFMSITYFDQIVVVWYWLLAVISGLDTFPVQNQSDSGSSEEINTAWERDAVAANDRLSAAG